MKTRGPCIAVRLLRPTGEVTFTEAFRTERRAEMRFSRLVEACRKDGWVGSRVQCLDLAGNVVHERRIVEG